MKGNTSNRIGYYDITKGILIILVVLGHVFQYANPRYKPPLSFLQGLILSFHMPAFFILSGYLFNYSKWTDNELSAFIQSRLKTLLVPYFSFELFAVLYKSLCLHKISLIEGILNIVTLKNNIGADWFLPAMFIAQVLLVICIKYLDEKLYLPVMVLCSYATWFIPKGLYWDPLCRGLLGFAFLILGFYLKRIRHVIESNNTMWLRAFYICLLLTFVFAAISFKYANNDFYLCTVSNPILFAISGISGFMMVLFMSLMIGKSNILEYIGKNSLIIMGTHQLVLYTVPNRSTIVWMILVVALIAVFESAVICFINRFAPFIVGKG